MGVSRISCCGRQSVERLSENGLKQSRANKETGLCQQSCKLIYAVQIHTQDGDKALAHHNKAIKATTDLYTSVINTASSGH